MPALRWAALSLCVILLGAVVFGLAPKLLPYLAARTGDPGWAGRALIILTLGKLIAAPLWPRVLTRLGPASSSAMAYFGASISVLGLLWMGVWPFGVDVALFGFGMSLGGVSVLSWVVLGDIADGIKRHTERAAGATLFGAVACAMKLSNGISGGLLGFAIGSNGQGLAARPLDLLILVMAGGGGLAALLLWRVKEPELITARLGHVTPTPGR